MRIVAAGGADVTISSPLQSAGADGQTNSTSGIPTYDLLSGFNDTTWDRLRALGDNADGVAAASLGRLVALARLSGYHGATWDRLLSEGNDRDAIANTTLGNLQTLGFPHGYNGASWDRLLSEGNDRDAIANTTLGNLQTLGFPHGYNGASWDRLLSEGNDRDAIANTTLGSLQTLGFPHGYNGASWDRVRTLGGTSLDGLGQLSVSPAVPGASAVANLYVSISSTTTRQTFITPSSGKRIRIISASLAWDNSATALIGYYFGTGAAVATNPASAILAAQIDVDVNPYVSETWPDGSGPVGAVDEVVSGRAGSSAGSTYGVIVYREE